MKDKQPHPWDTIYFRLAAEVFDIVVMQEVVEHLENVPHVFRELRRRPDHEHAEHVELDIAVAVLVYRLLPGTQEAAPRHQRSG